MTELKQSCFANSVFHDLKQTARCAKVLITQVFEKICPGAKPEEFGALDVLRLNPGICQRDLAKLILKDRASTGRILDSLESKRYITRYVDMKNNRLVRKMDITPEGLVYVNKMSEYLMEAFKIVSNHISEEEMNSIRTGLKKLREGLNEMVKMQI